MVRAAERVVALADSSKLGVERMVRFAALADIDVLVTDRNAPKDTIRELRDHGLEVVVA
jgi:DeoR family fructose operon transcriptional repressor